MNIIGYIFGIILQIIGTVILIIPIWNIPLSTREIIDEGSKKVDVESRKKENRKLFNIGISGSVLITIGLILQVYFTQY
jgi:hypothetical protein